jgi:hypothetical protein
MTTSAAPDTTLDDPRLGLADLLTALRRDYAAPTIPPCRVCGSPLYVAGSEPGRNTYRCSSDAADPRGKGDQADAAWEHYRASVWTAAPIDSRIRELCNAVDALCADRALLRQVLQETAASLGKIPASPQQIAERQALIDRIDRVGASEALVAAVPSDIQGIADRLHTQDARCTALPMYCVQRHRLIIGLDTSLTDRIGWMHDGELAPRELWPALDAAYAEDRSGIEVDGTMVPLDTYERHGLTEHWETVMTCLTEEGAKDYLAKNSHNLVSGGEHPPRIMVESFHRCAEMIQLRAWLMSLRSVPHVALPNAGPETPWFFAFKANGDTPWEVTAGSAEEMTALYEQRRQNWTDVLLGPVERGPADLVGPQRAGAAEPVGLRNTAIFLAKLWSDLDDLRYRVMGMSPEGCREAIIMQWPVLQGTRNQMDIRRLGTLPHQPQAIPREVTRAVRGSASGSAER